MQDPADQKELIILAEAAAHHLLEAMFQQAEEREEAAFPLGLEAVMVGQAIIQAVAAEEDFSSGMPCAATEEMEVVARLVQLHTQAEVEVEVIQLELTE